MGRSWYYKFYFEGKCKKLMLGTYPEISLECAKSRHQYARNLLAQGINPCEMKSTLGKNAFVRRMRDWDIAEYPRQQYSAGRWNRRDSQVTKVAFIFGGRTAPACCGARQARFAVEQSRLLSTLPAAAGDCRQARKPRTSSWCSRPRPALRVSPEAE